MPTKFSKSAIIDKNRISIEACDRSIDRLESIVGLSNAREIIRIAQLSRAINEKAFLRIINAHLRTAGTTMRPMDDALAAELNSLGNSLDIKIQNNQIINASLGFITSVLGDVSRMQTIIDSHKA